MPITADYWSHHFFICVISHNYEKSQGANPDFEDSVTQNSPGATNSPHDGLDDAGAMCSVVHTNQGATNNTAEDAAASRQRVVSGPNLCLVRRGVWPSHTSPPHTWLRTMPPTHVSAVTTTRSERGFGVLFGVLERESLGAAACACKCKCDCMYQGHSSCWHRRGRWRNAQVRGVGAPSFKRSNQNYQFNSC